MALLVLHTCNMGIRLDSTHHSMNSCPWMSAGIMERTDSRGSGWEHTTVRYYRSERIRRHDTVVKGCWSASKSWRRRKIERGMELRSFATTRPWCLGSSIISPFEAIRLWELLVTDPIYSTIEC